MTETPRIRECAANATCRMKPAVKTRPSSTRPRRRAAAPEGAPGALARGDQEEPAGVGAPAGTPSSRRSPAASRPIVSLISLGCAKNLVDSERILGQFAEAGFLIAAEPADSDLCLVNTCGFIRDAREESAAALRELAALKARGRPRFVVALGCLVERAADAPETARFLVDADARLGFADFPRLARLCREWLESGHLPPPPAPRGGEPRAPPPAVAYSAGGAPAAPRRKVPTSYAAFLTAPRLRIGSPHTAYLKISEGCSNPCRFCAIPRMRGLQVSRPIEQLVAEACDLVAGGARELNLIAQDTTSYGRDLYGRLALAELLRALARGVREPLWFRLLYAYPRNLTAAMLDVLASDARFCPYVDVPLQHISDPLLAAMGRGVTKAQTLAQLELIERKLPGAAVRTTFIVGYPGETEKHFAELLAFVREGRFTHAGVFVYSPEPLTAAADLPDRVPAVEKQRRRDALLRAQREVSRARMERRVGRPVEVLVDGPCPAGVAAPKGTRVVARSQWEAPEVDGVVFLRGKGTPQLPSGARLWVKAVEALDYDLVAELPA